MNNSSIITNFTGLSTEVYTGWQIVFTLITLPAAILSILSISALIVVKKIDWNLRIILINIFTAEFISSSGSTLIYLGYPLRMLFEVSNTNNQLQFPCSITISLLVIGNAAKVGSYTFYSIMAYVFIKKNIKKVKLYIMIIPCLIIWLPALIAGSIFFFFDRPLPMNAVLLTKGLCTVDLSDQASLRRFTIQLSVTWLLQGVLCGGIITTFFIVIARYVKKNVTNDNEIKVAIAKNLLFLSGGALVSIFIAVINPTVIRFTFSLDGVVASHYILDILRSFLSLYTPVVTIAFLKPIQIALSQLLKKCLTL